MALTVGLLTAGALRGAEVEVTLHQSDGTPLEGAVLVVHPLDARSLPPPAPAMMDQRDHRFVPHVLPVQTGATVRFPNSDAVSHHVYSFSPAKRFELFLAKGAPAKDVVFDRPGWWRWAATSTTGCSPTSSSSTPRTSRSPARAARRDRRLARRPLSPGGLAPAAVDPPAMLRREVVLAERQPRELEAAPREGAAAGARPAAPLRGLLRWAAAVRAEPAEPHPRALPGAAAGRARRHALHRLARHLSRTRSRAPRTSWSMAGAFSTTSSRLAARSLGRVRHRLAKDDALRQAVFSGGDDRESMTVALDNHRARTSADLALLVELDGTVLADTADRRREGRPFPFPALLREPASASLARPAIVALEEVAYQLVAVPYYVPVERAATQPLAGARPRARRPLRHRAARPARARGGVRAPTAAAPIAFVVARRGGVAHRWRARRRRGDRDGEASGGSRDDGAARSVAGGRRSDRRSAAPDRRRPARLSPALRTIRVRGARRGAARPGGRAGFRPRRHTADPRSEQAARRVAAGDYAAELPARGAVEIGSLAREFATMQHEVREREAAIERLAFHDELTGLPNRNRFRRELGAASRGRRATTCGWRWR